MPKYVNAQHRGATTARDLSQLRRDELLDMLVDVSEENDLLREAAGEAAEDVLTDDLRVERQRVRRERERKSLTRTIVLAVAGVVAAAVIISSVWLPVLRVSGTSMEPTLDTGDVVVALRTESLHTGDVVALYYNNRILLKRVIGVPGDTIDIDSQGNVAVNGIYLSEPYIDEAAVGVCDIELPYQVPDRHYFVMGDHRATSLDSRSSQVGCIPTDLILGRVLVRVWPLAAVGGV